MGKTVLSILPATGGALCATGSGVAAVVVGGDSLLHAVSAVAVRMIVAVYVFKCLVVIVLSTNSW